MELKLIIKITEHTVKNVLIVPLWNWNRLPARGRSHTRSVLIVPLWNWNDERLRYVTAACGVLIVPLWNWNMGCKSKNNRWLSINCTVVELKRRRVTTSNKISNVLIVPLWNWNRETICNSYTLLLVLIVPLWNWNPVIPVSGAFGALY